MQHAKERLAAAEADLKAETAKEDKAQSAKSAADMPNPARKIEATAAIKAAQAELDAANDPLFSSSHAAAWEDDEYDYDNTFEDDFDEEFEDDPDVVDKDEMYEMMHREGVAKSILNGTMAMPASAASSSAAASQSSSFPLRRLLRHPIRLLLQTQTPRPHPREAATSTPRTQRARRRRPLWKL